MQDDVSSRWRPDAAYVARAQAMTAGLAITALLLAAFPKIVLGQTSEEYAAMGQKVWDGS
jgi:hypothetical protein